MTLTDEQLNVEIAKLCGWKSSSPWWPDGSNTPMWEHPDGVTVSNGDSMPNYSGSLDAMRLAEPTLDEQERDEYAQELADCAAGFLHGEYDEINYLTVFNVATLPPRTRAECFYAVKSKGVAQ